MRLNTRSFNIVDGPRHYYIILGEIAVYDESNFVSAMERDDRELSCGLLESLAIFTTTTFMTEYHDGRKPDDLMI